MLPPEISEKVQKSLIKRAYSIFSKLSSSFWFSDDLEVPHPAMAG